MPNRTLQTYVTLFSVLGAIFMHQTVLLICCKNYSRYCLPAPNCTNKYCLPGPNCTRYCLPAAETVPDIVLLDQTVPGTVNLSQKLYQILFTGARQSRTASCDNNQRGFLWHHSVVIPAHIKLLQANTFNIFNVTTTSGFLRHHSVVILAHS